MRKLLVKKTAGIKNLFGILFRWIKMCKTLYCGKSKSDSKMAAKKLMPSLHGKHSPQQCAGHSVPASTSKQVHDIAKK
jgi:hypothetical protein